MKPRAVKFLVCPGCKGALELTIGAQEDGEVTDGTLACKGCEAGYPIVRGIPRFVRSSGYAYTFGREWHWFRQVQLDPARGSDRSERLLAQTTGWKEEDYAGRLVLDAGVGAGRYADVVARKGGEVVGVDLSEAVDAAYENVGKRPNVHLIQADIFALPFPEATFDLAYAIGVLHHTPEPASAFARVAATLKSKGSLAVYLYDRYGLGNHFSDAIRRVTTRLPLRLMLALSALAIPLYFVYRLPVLGALLRILCPMSVHPDWRSRWLDTFDWYTPKYQWKYLYPEIFFWFMANGFRDVHLFDGPIRMRGTKAD